MTKLSGLSRHPRRSLVSSNKNATRSMVYLAVLPPSAVCVASVVEPFPNPGQDGLFRIHRWGRMARGRSWSAQPYPALWTQEIALRDERCHPARFLRWLYLAPRTQEIG